MAEKSRIIYTEPNYVNGLNDNIDFSVPLEDLSISIDLVAEVKSRFRTSISDDEGEKYTMSWLGTNGNKESKVTFLRGSKLDKDSSERSLTTFYTDITYDDGKDGHVVEGLGISSIEVNFEAWFTPLVTINFTDVRGVSLFTPEEYSHYNKPDLDKEVYGDSIFKCFFSFPYPKFHLQVKGFYGQPVTYQLTCSKFNGHFNPKNGNFEATVQFIGYNYSLLTDVQFQYLVAAPYDEYFGKRYFEKKRSSSEWLLDDGTQIPTLWEFANKLAYSTDVINKLSNNDENVLKSRNISNEQHTLETILECSNIVLNDLRNSYPNHIMDNDSEQILFLFNSDSPVRLTASLLNYYNNLIKLLDEYNKNYPNNKIGSDKYFDGNTEEIKDGNLTPIKLFTITKSGNNKRIGVVENKSLSDITFSNKGKLSHSLIKNIERLISNKSDEISGEYGYLFLTNKLGQEILARKDDCDKRLASIQIGIDDFIKTATHDAIGFNPTIGNIFKILFAHLETYIQSIFACANTIIQQNNTGERSVSGYGLSLENTDINVAQSKDNQLPPFPLYLRQGTKGKQGGDDDDNLLVTGWVGDLTNRFEEIRLIFGYTRASENVTEISKDILTEINNENVIQDFLSISPIDLLYDKSYFSYSNVNGEDFGSFVGHLGIRAVQVLGTKNIDLNTSLIDEYGKADALNYYARGMDKDKIIDNILNKLNRDGSVGDEIISILCCSSGAEKYGEVSADKKNSIFSFEQLKLHDCNNRHPVFVQDDKGYLVYNFYPVYGEGNPIYALPCYSDIFGKGGYFSEFVREGFFGIPTIVDNINKKCIVTDEDELKPYYEGNLDINKYTNPASFQTYYGEDVKETVLEHLNLTSGNIKIRDYAKKIEFPEIKKQIGLTNLLPEFYYDTLHSLYEVPTDLLNFLPENTQESFVILNKDMLTNQKWKDLSKPIEKTDDVVSFDNLKGVDGNDVGKSYLPTISIYQDNTVFDLFGHSFYYLQNNKLEGENENEWENRRNKVKALLFLQSLPVKHNMFYPYAMKCVPRTSLLFAGALLWRYRYCVEKNLKDVIQYNSNFSNFISPSNDGGGLGLLCILESEKSNIGRLNISTNKRISKEIETEYYKYELFELRKSIQNKLIQDFEDFVKHDFQTIMSELELYDSEKKMLFTDATLYQRQFEWNSNFNNGKIKNFDSNKMNEVKTFIHGLHSDFTKNYMSFYSENNNLRLLFRPNTPIQGILKNLLFEPAVTTSGVYAYDVTKFQIKRNLAKVYFDSFFKQLNDIVTNNDTSTSSDPSEPLDVNSSKDLNIANYLSFKNIYDKWLNGAKLSDFNVSEFYNKNFVFVDSFYRDISDKLIINCNYFYKRYTEMVDESSFYSFINDILAYHGCLFTPMSNFIDWSKQDILDDMFKPIPFNSKMPLRENNVFVCMYIHQPSKNLNLGNNGSYGYKYDGFDIWDETHGGTVQPKIYLQNKANEQTKYAYDIPSFGVAYAKQNQSYFKDFKVSMDNPATTEYSIKAMYEIAKLGRDNANKVQFIGQDLYSVWSNYSYTVEIEMMGCAQVQPLMYFQLLNIPLWRGTYIITKVSHSLSPGNMITKFTGVKLCKNGQPFNSQAFETLGVLSKGSNYTETYSESVNEPSLIKLEESKYDKNYFFVDPKTISLPSIPDNRNVGWDGMNEYMKHLFYAIKETIKQLPENKDRDTWTIFISDGFRDKNAGYGSPRSAHKTGCAFDLQILRNGAIVGRGQNKRELGIVFDIIATTYNSYIDQLIMEYPNSNTISSGSWYNFHCLHLGSYGKSGEETGVFIDGITKNPKNGKNRGQIFVSFVNAANNTYPNINHTYKGNLILDYTPPFYKVSAKKLLPNYLPNNINKFKNNFLTFSEVSDQNLITFLS